VAVEFFQEQMIKKLGKYDARVLPFENSAPYIFIFKKVVHHTYRRENLLFQKCGITNPLRNVGED
jgi:hypothetical protein